MEEGEALSSLPGEHALVAVLRRHAATGELPRWVHEVSAYSASPFLLTAQKEKTIAADGSVAWYFFYTPARKEGTSSRYSRTAGGATWVEERTKPVDMVYPGGNRVLLGHATTFTYAKRTRGPDKRMQTHRLGWILVEVRLPGDDLCCAKLYASPRTPQVAPPAAPAPAPEEGRAPAPEEGRAPAPGLGAPAPPLGAPARGLGAPAPPLGAPARGLGAPAPPLGAPAPALGAPAPGLGAPAPRAPAPAPAPEAPAPVAPASAAVGEDGTKWIKIRVSSSPTKSPCFSKKVYEIEDEANAPKRRLLNCGAWLSVNYLHDIASGF